MVRFAAKDDDVGTLVRRGDDAVDTVTADDELHGLLVPRLPVRSLPLPG